MVPLQHPLLSRFGMISAGKEKGVGSIMYDGILVGLTSFLVIGIFHPIVIRAEYHWSKKCWPLFLVVGLLLLICSILLDSFVLSAVVGVTGFSCLLLASGENRHCTPGRNRHM